MSNATETPAIVGNVTKRKRGRPKKIRPAVQETATNVAPAPKVAKVNEAELLSHDKGDISARESWSPRSGNPFARRENYPVTMSYLPDLNPPETLVFRHDPTKQFNRVWLEEDGSRHARNTALFMTRKGYIPATSGDFLICPELRDFIRPDDNDRLVYADLNGNAAAVIMVRDAQQYAKDRKELLRHSDEIQLSAEEKAARLQENLRRQGMAGVTASSVMTDEG